MNGHRASTRSPQARAVGHICLYWIVASLVAVGRSGQTEFDGRDDELKALQFDALTETGAKIKAETGAERPS